LIIILILGIVGFSECINSEKNTTSNQNITNQSQPAIDNSIFENQYLSFKKPIGLMIVDNSNDTTIDIKFYQNNKFIGVINSATNSQDLFYSEIQLKSKIKVSGNLAYEFSDPTTIQSYIPISKTNDKITAIWIKFDRSFSPAYNLIKPNFIIKKNPTE
jgi:hypothetical protein